MSHNKRLILASLGVLFVNSLYCFTATYEVKALGLRIARLNFTSSAEEGFTEVRVESSITKVVSTEINNIYRSLWATEFMPQRYTRSIRQGKDIEDVDVVYDRDDLQAKANYSSLKSSYNYPITADQRDLFTLLSYIASGKASPGAYTVDGNGCQWSIKLCKDGRERIKNELGEFSCNRYLIVMEPLFEGDMPYVDKITDVLLNKSNRMILWVSQEGIPMKATFRRGIFYSVCDIVSFSS